jgi:hypothetical protein
MMVKKKKLRSILASVRSYSVLATHGAQNKQVKDRDHSAVQAMILCFAVILNTRS